MYLLAVQIVQVVSRMIRTSYTDSAQIRGVLENNPGDDRLVAAGAVLDDLGISICNRQEDFNQLSTIVPEHLWLGDWHCEEWFLVLHRRMEDVLPETI